MSKSGKTPPGVYPNQGTAPPAYSAQPPPYAPQNQVPMQAQYSIPPQAYGQQYIQAYGYPQGYPYGYTVQAQGQPPAYSTTVAQGQPMQAAYPQMVSAPQTVVCPGLFDAGARFDGNAQSRIPSGSGVFQPPPPGVMPNAAQLASMQGHTVVGTQRKNDIWGEGSGGGYTFW